jgi:dipeptidyl aminopeptidase/acylaminoacyl peptidase
MRRILSAAVTALAIVVTAPAAARPFTVDDLLHQESFGVTAISPDGRWLVIERRDPYDTAPAFDHDQDNTIALSRLLVVDLRHPAAARPLLPAEGPGEVIAAFSPSGTRLAIYRLRGASWTLGVVTLATGEVRWFDVTPAGSDFGRTLQWRSDTELLLIDAPDRRPPWGVRLGRLAADVLPARWAAGAAGAGAQSVAGSGAYRDRRDHAAPRRLLSLDVLTGHTEVLSRGDLTDLELSPDGRRVALMEAGEDLQPRADGPAQGVWGLATQSQHVSVLDLTTGARRTPCPSCDALAYLLSWSPQSRSLLVFVRPADAPWTDGALQIIDAATGATRTVGRDLVPRLDQRPEIVRAGWMGGDPIVLARPGADPAARFDWYRLTDRGSINLTRRLAQVPTDLAAVGARSATAVAGGAVWRLDGRGGVVRLADDAEIAGRAGFASDGRLVVAPRSSAWVLAGSGVTRTLQRLDDHGLADVVVLRPGAGRLTAASSTPATALLRTTDPRGPETLDLVAPGSPPLRVAEVNAGLADIDRVRIEAIHHLGPDGQALTSWLFLPTGAGGKPPPLLVRAYAGDTYRAPPRDVPPGLGLIGDTRTLVAHGYAVLRPSLPAPRGSHDPTAGLADRIGAVVDAAAQAPGLAGTFDPGRVVLWGHSFGGYTVMAAIGQSDRFRAAVSISGISDLFSKWGDFPAPHRLTTDEGLWADWTTGSVESGQGLMGAPPWAQPGRYMRNSPFFSADKIRTPLLLFHGDLDGLSVTQSEMMFTALYRQDKDAMLVTLWGEGHFISSPGNVRELYSRAFAFLDGELAKPHAGTGAPPRHPEPVPASAAPTPPQP